MRRLLPALIVSAAVAVVTPAVHAAVLLTPSADTYINSGVASTAQGGATSLVHNTSASPNRRWAYVSFDLSSFLPTETITSAKLELFRTSAGLAGANQDVYGLTSNKLTPAAETTLTWTNDPNRDATTTPNSLKLANVHGGTAFANFPVTTPATTTAPATDVAFNTTAGDVINYLNANLGGTVTFAFYGPQRTSDQGGWIWNSREAAANKPTLTLESVPEPGSLGVLCVAAAAATFRRRRVAR